MIVYLFLPVQRAVVRKVILIILSILFYAWGDASTLPMLLLSVLFNYATAQEIIRFREMGNEKYAKISVISGTAINVILLAIFKYTSVGMPLGISFYTFSALSYIFDHYYGRCEEDRNFLNAVFYITFFPKVVSGPIIQYQEFQKQIEDYAVKWEDVLIGCQMFIVGLFKKVLLADNLGAAFGQISAMDSKAAMTAFLGMVFYGLQLLFDFSGYSDMAIGLAKIFGFRFEKNFDYPYTSMNIGEFWRRWHISLGAWFRQYVYIPLGGNRCSVNMQIRNLSIVWLLTGIWHGSTLNFLIWGIWHGAFVILERFVIKDKMDRVPGIVRILLTDLIVFIGWIFFFSPNMMSAFGWIGSMIGFGGAGLVDNASIYYLYTNIGLLLFSILCCSPLLGRVSQRLIQSKDRHIFIAMQVIYAVLFLFCIASSVGSTYQSFLYFKF